MRKKAEGLYRWPPAPATSARPVSETRCCDCDGHHLTTPCGCSPRWVAPQGPVLQHNPTGVESSLAPLLALYERERSAGRSLVLGIVLETAGSTYRKPGALMLIASDGDYAGLLSGGCLEGDLREHASTVRVTGVP